MSRLAGLAAAETPFDADGNWDGDWDLDGFIAFRFCWF
jgi:hypothetical protein